MKKVCENLYEKEAWQEGKCVLGMDEAGRGPLAGPMVVAGVIFPIGYQNEDIYDSKAISEKKRNALFEIIRRDALWYKIVEVDVATIDRYNIYRADQRTMLAIAKESQASVILSDAMPLEGLNARVIDLVKGDQKSISIAASSILAKVHRDRIMVELDQQYPQYGFCRNKGYGTKEHLAALEHYGPCPFHRKSFTPVSLFQQKLDLF